LAAYKSKKLINWRWPWSITYKVVIANLLMAVIIWPLRHWAGQGSIQLLIIIGLAALIYGLSLLILKAFDWRRWLTILRPSVDRLK
jgi:peptidoglycan biosynthesis protein MviN/MurJ (putative lipid II flippase)